jgi:tripartite-type tricarboxylate transporter receptor subunit TctC
LKTLVLFTKLPYLVVFILAQSLLLISAQAVEPTTYPNQTVHVTTPFPPGGAADVVVRLISQKLTEELGASFIVDNKPGAGGSIGAKFVSQSSPDGYNLLITSSSTMSINPHFMKKIGYDPFTSFTPISLIGYSPNVFVVTPNLPFKNVQEFIAAAKANPGKYNFASNGPGTSSHLTGELFQQSASIELLHVPYKGASPAVVDVAGGQVTGLFAAFASVGPLVKSGKLKALGVTSLKRMEIAPQIPTLNESGLPNFESLQWWAVYGPANMPVSIQNKLNEAVNKILKQPDTKVRFAEESIFVLGGSPDDLKNYLRSDYNKWGKVISTGKFTLN